MVLRNVVKRLRRSDKARTGGSLRIYSFRPGRSSETCALSCAHSGDSGQHWRNVRTPVGRNEDPLSDKFSERFFGGLPSGVSSAWIGELQE